MQFPATGTAPEGVATEEEGGLRCSSVRLRDATAAHNVVSSGQRAWRRVARANEKND